MAVGDVYQCQIFYNIGSELTMNVVHLRETLASTDDIPAETVCKVIYTAWQSRYGQTIFSNQAHVILIKARRIRPTTGVPATLVLGTVAFPIIDGTGTAAPVPSQAALLVSLYTDVMTKSGRGRIYIPGVAGASQNDGQIIEAEIPEAQGWEAEFEATQVAVGPDTGEWVFAVYSRALLQANQVTQAVVHTNLATQRGRRNFPGVGA